MDGIKRIAKTRLEHHNTWSSFSIYRNIFGTRDLSTHYNYKNHGRHKRHRHNKYLLPVILSALFTSPIRAETVGGVSATANPVANSSGSVTNQAIQVLQGPYITNTYGNGIQCQGPTLNITPFLTKSLTFQEPYEAFYNDPVYDLTKNDDGNLANPGSILYYVPTRTGQKQSNNWNWGLSATVSFPLDGGLQERCKAAADTYTSLQGQLIANKRLDFEISRLKNCGELMQKGIMFHPKSPYYKVCADVVLVNPPGVLPKHRHPIPPITSLTPSSKSSKHDSDPSEQEVSLDEKEPSLFSRVKRKSSSQPSSQLVLPILEVGQPVVSQ